MQERKIQNKIMLAVTKFGRIFRNNVGRTWAGASKRTKDGGIYIEKPRPFHSGLCKGSSDLIGWVTIEIDGRRFAVCTAIEVKTETGKATPEQIKFIQTVKEAGGIAGICRSAEDAQTIIEKFINK